VIAADGSSAATAQPATRAVLDPRVAYLTTSLMEDVINHGTGYPVRAMGFEAPAAGKTGTSRDGWFAGFTSNLLCVVWIGFDDNRDLGLAGGQAAAPVWGEFMKRAVLLPKYRNTQEFQPPPGVTEASIDPQTGQLANNACPTGVSEHFIAGSEPTQYCDGSGATAQSTPGSWLKSLFGKGENSAAAQPTTPPSAGPPTPSHTKPPYPANPGQSNGEASSPEPEKKKGFLGKIFGIFGGNKEPASSSKPQQ